jgi:hypothetical protein
MAVAQGTCPSCGAPIEFGVGSSLAKVCEYCRATVLRTDRGLQNLGKVADLAHTPSLIAVGDEGTLGGRPFQVLGRVQLDHGAGPWDEYYVAFDYGQTWGWLAYAQGHWYVTTLAHGIAAPPLEALRLEMDVPLGQYGAYRVTELKQGSIHSAEGELPGALRPGFVRHYADCYGPQNAFATIDYGENTGGCAVFVGWIFDEPQMQVMKLGPRSAHKIKTEHIKCPGCGGDIPKLSGDRAERVGCPYCGAVSDIAAEQVIARQEAALKLPDIPIGSRGNFEGLEYVCIAYVRRGSDFDGDHFSWEEYLLWSQAVGFRWLVKDPESGWSWVVPANPSEVDLSRMPESVTWGGRTLSMRNENDATVEYVLGEVYWKCEVGETTHVMDFVHGRDVLGREQGAGEVHWSYATPVPWAVIAGAFSLPVDGAGGRFAGAGGGGGVPAAAAQGGCSSAVFALVIIAAILMLCMLGTCGACGPTYAGTRGGGVYYGGK